MASPVRHNSGFVLLMVLMVLVIAATLLAASAGRHGELAMRAGAAQRRLQQKWGTRSCVALCLPSAERVLTLAGGSRDCRTISLGKMQFDLLFADEQAKANLNLLAFRKTAAGVVGEVGRLQPPQSRPLRVFPRPSPAPVCGIRKLPIQFDSLDQVFEFEHPSELLPERLDVEGPLARITCWGGGKLNFHRAELSVLRCVLDGVLDDEEVGRLDDFRKERPDCTLEEAIQHLELAKDRRQAARDALTDSSQCHSLWVIARGATRSWYSLFVSQSADDQNDKREWRFVW